MVIFAVDPGKEGCLCTYDGVEPAFFDTPTYKIGGKSEYDLGEMARLLMEAMRVADKNEYYNAKPGGEKAYAVIEQVSGRPGEGTVSARSIGYGAGIWHMAFTVFGIPYEKVPPQTWKKAFGLIGAEKKASIAIAKQRFPSASLDRVKDHNRADALLMALWLWERRR